MKATRPARHGPVRSASTSPAGRGPTFRGPVRRAAGRATCGVPMTPTTTPDAPSPALAPTAGVPGAPPAPAPTPAPEIARLFAAQQANRWRVARSTAAERAATLARLGAAIAARRGEIAAAAFADFRKPAAEVELTEIHPTLAEIKLARRKVAAWMRPRRVPTPLLLFGTASEVRCEPRGVVLILAPWNYAFSLVVSPLVAAIAAGNCAILKPSEKTPHTSAFLKRFVADLFDESEVAVVEGGTETAARPPRAALRPRVLHGRHARRTPGDGRRGAPPRDRHPRARREIARLRGRDGRVGAAADRSCGGRSSTRARPAWRPTTCWSTPRAPRRSSRGGPRLEACTGGRPAAPATADYCRIVDGPPRAPHPALARTLARARSSPSAASPHRLAIRRADDRHRGAVRRATDGRGDLRPDPPRAHLRRPRRRAGAHPPPRQAARALRLQAATAARWSTSSPHHGRSHGRQRAR